MDSMGPIILVVILMLGLVYLVRAYVGTRYLGKWWRVIILGSLVLVELCAAAKLYDEVVGDSSNADSLGILLPATIVLAIWLMRPHTWARMAACGKGRVDAK